MREIKFRAWDKLSKWTTPVVCLNLGTMRDIILIDPRSDKVMTYLSSVDDVIIEQYTGLKDKNGVEIYEGGILREPATSDFEKANYNSWEVFHHDNDMTPTDCGLVLGRLKTHGSSAGGYSPWKLIPKHVKRLEVIGNIHEETK